MRTIFRNGIEFLLVLSIMIGNIVFLLLSAAGIEYDPEEGGGLVGIIDSSLNIFAIAWVVYKEISTRPVRGAFAMYFFPLIPIFCFFLESVFIPEMTLSSFAGKRLIFFGALCIGPIYLANYIYRHDRFDMIVKQIEPIMLLGSLGLVLNIPAMLFDSVRMIAGGGYQVVSYGAAFMFLINLTVLLNSNSAYRYALFNNKLYRLFSFLLLSLQAVICLLGGGRGGAVLLVSGSFLSLFLFSRANFKKTVIIAILGLLSFIVVAKQTGLSDSVGFGRAFNYINGTNVDVADTGREGIYGSALKAIDESPIIGHGIWGALIAVGFYSHNIFMDVMAQGGIVYLSVFLLMLIKVYRSGYRLMTSKSGGFILFPLLLYPIVNLMFSAFYLNDGLFMFGLVYCYLCRKQV